MRRLLIALLFALPILSQTHVTQTECEALVNGSGGSGAGGRMNNVDFINCITSAPGWSDNVNAQVGTTYTILEEDAGRLTTLSNASPVAVTLPQAGTTGFEDGSWFPVKNIGAGTATITPTTSTIDGSATLALLEDQWAVIYSDGTNYHSFTGASTPPGGASGDVQYNDGASGFTAESAFNYDAAGNLLKIYNSNIGATLTPSLRLENSTAAVLDTQQRSPALTFKGYGWNKDTSASESVEWFIEAVPMQHSASGPADSPYPDLRIGYTVAGGSYVPFLHQTIHPDAYDSDFNLANLWLGINAGPTAPLAAAMANIGIGYNAINNLTGGSENLGIGNQVMEACTTCYWNVAIGHEALYQVTTGYQNAALGQNAGWHATSNGNQNTFFGVWSDVGSDSDGTQRPVSQSSTFGYNARVEWPNVGVLGQAGTNWAVGGLPVSQEELEVADPGELGSETLNETDFATHANWNASGDFTDSTGAAVYAHSGGWGYLVQPFANQAFGMLEDRWYRLQYVVSGLVGNPSCQLQLFPDASYDMYDLTAGTQIVHFRSNATAGQDFQINCNSDSGDDTITFDDFSLKVVTGGDLRVNRDIYAGGDVTAKGSLMGGNGASVASATTTALGVGNLFHITGTTTITTVNTCDVANEGRTVTLIFDDVLTFTDGSNLKLAGNFTTSADDTIALVCDGSNWYEVSRSAN